MLHALHVAPFGELAEPSVLVDLATAAEEHGWDAVYLWDHVYRDPARTTVIGDAWVSMAAMITATERIWTGPLVTPLARRRPHVVARQSVALDRLSGGRFVMGLGLGVDRGGELSRFGELTDAVARGDQLDEGAELLLAFWSGEPVTFDGRYFTADGVQFRPGPVRGARMPLWFAARGDARRPLRRAARLGDGVHAIEMDHDQFRRALDLVVAERGSLDGFDVATNVEPGDSGDQWAEMGVTWIIHEFAETATAAEVHTVIGRGVPR